MKRFIGITVLAMVVICLLAGGVSVRAEKNDPPAAAVTYGEALSFQSEAKVNLRQLFTVQVSYFGEKNYYAAGECFKELGWKPEGPTRYAYFCGTGYIPNTIGKPIPNRPPIKPFINKDAFLIVAVGNIDGDSTLDVWTLDDGLQIKNVTPDLDEFTPAKDRPGLSKPDSELILGNWVMAQHNWEPKPPESRGELEFLPDGRLLLKGNGFALPGKYLISSKYPGAGQLALQLLDDEISYLHYSFEGENKLRVDGDFFVRENETNRNPKPFKLATEADLARLRTMGIQSEAKTNLGAIFTCQVAHFGEKNFYAGGPKAFTEIYWAPEGKTTYAYFCGSDYIPNTLGQPIPNKPPAGVGSTNEHFKCAAVGNIDGDSTLDIWTIDDEKKLVNVQSDL